MGNGEVWWFFNFSTKSTFSQHITRVHISPTFSRPLVCAGVKSEARGAISTFFPHQHFLHILPINTPYREYVEKMWVY